SGSVLSPEEFYAPDNVFMRVLRIRAKSVMTVPRLFSYTDAERLRITGIFREDVVVDGVPGGVKTYEDTDD
ncbi:hypothetical protein K0U83_16995, partial [bacterium]|nr:hypothetical protein [bacterium]